MNSIQFEERPHDNGSIVYYQKPNGERICLGVIEKKGNEFVLTWDNQPPPMTARDFEAISDEILKTEWLSFA